MTPLLLAPLGLAALAALIVPLVIHIRRRTEEVPVDFAALRWLDAKPRPRSRLRFDEWLLLALRLLIVACLALLLARPAVLGWEGNGPRILAAPGVSAEAARKAAGPEADLRWIAPGFLEVGEGSAPAGASLSSLIRQYDAELPEGAALTILVPPVLDGVDAAPLRLTRKVTWRVVEGSAASRAPEAPAAPALALRYAEGQGGAVRYFRAAAAAWSDAPRFEASTASDLPQRGAVLVWLKPGRVPAAVTDWVSAGGTALLGSAVEVAMPAATAPLWRDETGGTLAEGGVLGKGRIIRFTRPLEPAAMPDLLAGSFPANLRDLVTPPAPPPARVEAAAFAPVAGVAPFRLPPHELSAWLGVLIAALFLAERWLASRRRRFAA
ncbi:BatA domain-containing protein [Erythrobacter colymbi]|uniref:BatA domain-containing protein n=1 Tax=Erythrobacter colymbi TaxID=1161202 RepID=UPI000A39311F|nr:BatA domain-containing protein [Erythrobacter colymbi]